MSHDLCRSVKSTIPDTLRQMLDKTKSSGLECGVYLCDDGTHTSVCTGDKTMITGDVWDKLECPVGSEPRGRVHTHPFHEEEAEGIMGGDIGLELTKTPSHVDVVSANHHDLDVDCIVPEVDGVLRCYDPDLVIGVDGSLAVRNRLRREYRKWQIGRADPDAYWDAIDDWGGVLDDGGMCELEI